MRGERIKIERSESEEQKMKETELKPCPFCGGEAELRFDKPTLYEDSFRQYSLRADVKVKCKKCHFEREAYRAYVDLDIDTMELKGSILESRALKHVVKQWNRRADDEQREDLQRMLTY